MRLPNAVNAVVDLAKLRDYCLNPDHPRGRHNARVFASAVGLTASSADWLRLQLLAAARREDAKVTRSDDYGTRYVLDFVVEHADKAATVRSSWIVRTGEDHPRLTSCFVLL